MHYTPLAFVSVALLRFTSAASYTVTLFSSATTSLRCTTRSSSISPASVKTQYSRKTLPPAFFIFTSTSTPYKTITPRPSTTTVVSTVVDTSTSTFTGNTNTQSSTESYYTTVTSTITATSTRAHNISTVFETVTSTTVIPAPSDFVTVEQSTNLTTAGQASQNETREVIHGNVLSNSAYTSSNNGLSHGLAQSKGTLYEYAVHCVNRIQPTITIEVIKLHSTVKTTLPVFTTTTMSESTSTTTVTAYTTASTTVTISTTLTSTKLATTTTTTTTSGTTTLTGTMTTSVLAACSTNNILGPALSNGRYQGGMTLNNGVTGPGEIDGFSAYDCCVQCIETPGCLYTAFIYGSSCVPSMEVDGTCPTGQPQAGYIDGVVSPDDRNIYVSNGLCGSLGYEGYDP